MSIFKTYVKGDIKNNRKSYNSTRITIFLAVVILSTFVFGVASYFKSYIDMLNHNIGGAHFRIISTISSKDANNLVSNRHIKKIGFFNIKEIKEGFGSKEKAKLFRMDDNAISTMKSSLKEGELPKEGQVMISDNMSREIGKGLGDNIEVENKIYHISGIHYDTTHEYKNFYNIYINVSQDTLLHSKEELSPFIWYKNIYRTYGLSEKIIESLETKDITYNYNDLYLNMSFVFDPKKGLLEDYTSQVLILFIILIVFFYSIIVNLFVVQESKSIVEYSKLKSIGATNKDISKIIRLKTIYISQIPIVLGILSSLGLVKIVFFIIKGVDKYFSGGKDIYSIYMYLNLDFKLVLFVYILSFAIIYLSTKNPIKKLKKNSILNGLRGNIKGKSYKKHDLEYRGNIGKDISKQFYKNSKYDFRFTGITLKLGFLLMIFIMIAITCYSMDKKYNHVSKYETYDIQCEYATLNPLNKDFIKDIRALEVEELVNFRKESVYLDFDESLVSSEYKNTGSLSSLKEEIKSFNNMRVEIFGIEDEKFKELVLEKGLNPDDYVGNKAILLNTMGNDFNVPVSKRKSIKFLKDNINKLSLTEYGSVVEDVGNRGHEFNLNVEDKIDNPLLDYSIINSGLTLYMPKSQYIKLFNNFLRIADLDQYEYISLKTDNIAKVQESINNISLEYFKESDYLLESKLDEEMLVKKRNVIGSILAIFLSMFFVVVGFSNCYYSFYNLFLKRRDELLLYNAIGMDGNLLEGILEGEKKKIVFSFIYAMPFIILAVVYAMAKLSKIFEPIDILLNLNYLFILVILGYILIIYVSISKMYNKYKNEIIGK